MGHKNHTTGHSFRHTASTILNEQGFNADNIERQLAHVEENKIRGTYNQAEYLPQRREIMQWWSNYLEAPKKNIKASSSKHVSGFKPEQVSIIAAQSHRNLAYGDTECLMGIGMKMCIIINRIGPHAGPAAGFEPFPKSGGFVSCRWTKNAVVKHYPQVAVGMSAPCLK